MRLLSQYSADTMFLQNGPGVPGLRSQIDRAAPDCRSHGRHHRYGCFNAPDDDRLLGCILFARTSLPVSQHSRK